MNQKWISAYRDAMSFRASHYFVSFMSEASSVAAGFGYKPPDGASPRQGLLYRWTEHFLKKWPLGEEKRPPKLHNEGGFFEPWSFMILKNSYQDLSNERSNFTKEFLEVNHWALKQSHFLTNYLKLQILASYNNLRIGQDSEFAKFWPRTLTM